MSPYSTSQLLLFLKGGAFPLPPESHAEEGAWAAGGCVVGRDPGGEGQHTGGWRKVRLLLKQLENPVTFLSVSTFLSAILRDQSIQTLNLE